MATVSEEPIKKDTLLLHSLEIRSFRGFQHLRIEHLGRVNLIVGKNNVGKTALLEALRLYASKGSPTAMLELLGLYNENEQFSLLIATKRLAALKYLFYGRQDASRHLGPIQIGPIDSEAEKIIISMSWNKLEIDERGERSLRRLKPEEYHTPQKLDPYLSIQMGERDFIYLVNSRDLTPPFGPDPKQTIGIFRGPDGLSKQEVGRLWDSIALTDLEQEVIAALRIIAPGVERLNFVADPASSGERIPIVKVQGIEEPLPLSNLGDGMERMLGIALALVNAKDGMLLVDEIENGLHYSVLPDLWRMVFQIARRLNIQVFATTHSWDCIEGFQEAAQEDKQTEGMLIRLDWKKDKILPTLFDERELGIAIREQIEVR